MSTPMSSICQQRRIVLDTIYMEVPDAKAITLLDQDKIIPAIC